MRTTLIIALSLMLCLTSRCEEKKDPLPLCKTAVESCRALIPLYETRDAEQEATKVEMRRQLDAANRRTAEAIAKQSPTFGGGLTWAAIGFGLGILTGALILK
jgi:hypothetical protein